MAGRYKAYPEYNNSPIDWLDEIPTHWTTKKLKHLGEAIIGLTYSPDEVVDASDPDATLVLRSSNVQNQRITLNDNVFVSKQIPEKLSTRLNDILICSRNGSRALIGKNALIDKDSVGKSFGAFMTIYRSKYNTYLSHVMNSKLFEYQSGSFLTSTINQLTTGNLNSFEIPFPSEAERVKIANFLDHETAKIDTLIAKQEKLIELLKEKRQAVISHAVTKGLNSNAPMKDSGVEWLGEVPEHWVIKSYRYACKIYRGKFGHRPRNDPAFYDGEYPFIQTGDVARAGKYIKDYKQTLNEKGIGVSQKFPVGTLMMAIAANIGDTAILGFEAYAPDSVVGFKPKSDIDLEFLRYSFMAAFPALEQTSTQSTQANLNVDRIGAVQASFPSISEQREIVAYLDTLLEQYDDIESKSQKSIELMKERKTALISAAVTGKIDVRVWEPQGVQG